MKPQIKILKNGPALVTGEVEWIDAEGQPIEVKGPSAALCRCGQSKKKPFCDGSHKTCGFQG